MEYLSKHFPKLWNILPEDVRTERSLSYSCNYFKSSYVKALRLVYKAFFKNCIIIIIIVIIRRFMNMFFAGYTVQI